jgi:tRNA threonylcarbamoyladenosine biosynthesis protein TsaB
MRILAIDTSVGTGSVAAVDEAGSAERSLGPAGGHARVLTAALAEAAAARGWPGVGDLGGNDVIAVVKGPGSFTGLRVGVATAKALAWATGSRLVGVSGFDVLVRQASRIAGWRDAPLAIAYDAGRGEVYTATAVPAGDGWSIPTAVLVPLDDWLRALPRGGHVTGPAVDAAAGRIAARDDLSLAPAAARQLTALGAAAVARERIAAGFLDDPRTLVPDYLRPSYAEERPTAAGR